MCYCFLSSARSRVLTFTQSWHLKWPIGRRWFSAYEGTDPVISLQCVLHLPFVHDTQLLVQRRWHINAWHYDQFLISAVVPPFKVWWTGFVGEPTAALSASVPRFLLSSIPPPLCLRFYSESISQMFEWCLSSMFISLSLCLCVCCGLD